MEPHSAADIPRRNTLERAIKYVKNAKYRGVDRLIKGKPLLTWGLKSVIVANIYWKIVPFKFRRKISQRAIKYTKIEYRQVEIII